MKKLLFALLAIATVVSVNAQVTKTIPVDKFSSLDISGVYDVTLIKSDECSIEVTCSENIQDYLDIYVSSGVLHLGVKNDNNPKSNVSIKAVVKMKELSTLEMSGATKLKTSSSFNAKYFTGKFSGASTVQGINVFGETMKVIISGASNVSLTGEFTSTEIGLSGASTVNLVSKSNSTDISLSGSCKLMLEGRSDRSKIIVSGASSLIGGSFSTLDANVSASGASSVSINVNKELNATASGASSIRYGGNPPNVKADSGKASSISKN